MSIESVYKKCPQKVSTQNFHKKCLKIPTKISIKSAHKKSVHKKCLIMWSQDQWEASEKTASDGAHRHTDRHTDGHRDPKTEWAQLADSVKTIEYVVMIIPPHTAAWNIIETGKITVWTKVNKILPFLLVYSNNDQC